VAPADEELLARIKELIEQHPTYGYRRIWARLRFGDGRVVNHKKVYRLMQAQRWMVYQRPTAPKPRVQRKKSVAARANERWAVDATHIDCGADGWGHLIAVIDCYDRELVGWEFALRGRANEAERALEMACLHRFGTVRPQGAVPILRSDNGLIFQSRRFRDACRFYRVPQEFITPYTPEQNGVIERWFRSLKEECVWQHQFRSFADARQAIRRWIAWYNAERPHQALGYQSPQRYRQIHDPPPE
jgi:putative transposase